MLEEGKITHEQAVQLLDTLAKIKQGGQANPTDSEATTAKLKATSDKPKYLRVIVDEHNLEGNGDKVNIRIPLELLRLGAVSGLPKRIYRHLPEGELKSLSMKFDTLSSLRKDEFYDTVADLEVEVEAEGGDKVKVWCE